MNELKILEEKKNDLFNRKEVKAVLDSNTTPSREQVLELLSKKFSVPTENIKITGVHGKFGTQSFDISANIYASEEEKNKIEIKKKKEADAEKRAAEAQKQTEEPKKETKEPVEQPKENPEQKQTEEPKKEETKPEEKTTEEPKIEEQKTEAKQ